MKILYGGEGLGFIGGEVPHCTFVAGYECYKCMINV